MSWSATVPVTEKAGIEQAIDAVVTSPADLNGPMFDQLHTAQLAAKLIARCTPGPKVHVSMSGHANGVGWQKKEGWANDCITVSVTQDV